MLQEGQARQAYWPFARLGGRDKVTIVGSLKRLASTFEYNGAVHTIVNWSDFACEFACIDCAVFRSSWSAGWCRWLEVSPAGKRQRPHGRGSGQRERAAAAVACGGEERRREAEEGEA